jgi:hypothetical protein
MITWTSWSGRCGITSDDLAALIGGRRHAEIDRREGSDIGQGRVQHIQANGAVRSVRWGGHGAIGHGGVGRLDGTATGRHLY